MFDDIRAGWNAVKKAAVDAEISALKAFTGRDIEVVHDLSELVKPGCRNGLLSLPPATKDARQR